MCLQLSSLQFAVRTAIRYLCFRFCSFVYLSFRSFPCPTPSMATRESYSLFFKRPSSEYLTCSIIFKSRARGTKIQGVSNVINACPMMIFNGVTILRKLTFRVGNIILSFNLFLFIGCRNVSRRDLIPQVCTCNFTFTKSCREFRRLRKIFLSGQFCPTVPIRNLFRRMIFVATRATCVLC